MKNKITEEQFDSIFSSKPRQYSFDKRPKGRKDRQIIKTLTNFGIEGKKCLDIGSGSGRWLQFLKMHDPFFLASIDISEEAIKRARRVCDKAATCNVEHENLPFEEVSFDLIVSFEVIEHLVCPQNYLKEIIRVAKNGTLVMISAPNVASLNSRLRLLLGIPPVAMTSDPTHVSVYTHRTLKKLLKSMGQSAEVIPTSISLHPKSFKKWRLPSVNIIESLADGILIKFIVKK